MEWLSNMAVNFAALDVFPKVLLAIMVIVALVLLYQYYKRGW